MKKHTNDTQAMKEKLGIQDEEIKEQDNIQSEDDDDMGDTIEASVEKTAPCQQQDVDTKQQLAAIQDKLLRSYADIENIRRRAERDVAKAHKYGLEKFVNELLPVIDSLEQALDHAFENKEAKAIHQGVELTMKMLVGALKKFGVEQLDPIDDCFNPQYHEAMSMVAKKDRDANIVTEVLQKGYRLNGRLVRPARVIITT